MSTQPQLEGRHAIVTGGGSGVGAAAAIALAAAGASVSIIGRRSEALEAIASQHESIKGYVADVTDRHGLESSLERCRADAGPVAIAVASAGISSSKPFHRLTTDDLDTLMNTNVTGVFHTFQLALADMRETGWGRLIAIASTAGLTGYPYVSHYCASKHAVVGMVRAVAQETASRGVTTNALCPSYIDTPMTDRTIENIMQQTGRSHDDAEAALVVANPQGRLISPEEIAGNVVWLCSDAAASLNGKAIALDGGEL